MLLGLSQDEEVTGDLDFLLDFSSSSLEFFPLNFVQ